MRVKELLREADIDKQVELVLKRQPDYEKPYDKEVVKQNLTEFLAMLDTLTPKDSEDDAAPYVMVAEKYYDTDFDDNIQCYTNMELYSKKELISCIENLPAVIPVVPDNLEELTSEEVKQVLNELPSNPIGYGYEFTEWEEVLNFEVLYIPEGAERQEYISDILYEMSFNGMTRDSQVERREELEASIKESEEIRKLPKEEQEKHYHSIDELFDVLGYTPPSEEEREENRKRTWICAVKSKLYRFQNYRNITV